MTDPYRTPSPPSSQRPAPGCNHSWEARPIWAWDDWVILSYDRRCSICLERPSLLRRAWFSILDELRRLGLYDTEHRKLGAERSNDSLHQEPPGGV